MEVLTNLLAPLFDRFKTSNPVWAIVIISLFIGAQHFITTNPQDIIPENIANLILLILRFLLQLQF